MKPREVKRLFIAHGWTLTEGSKHTQATRPDKPGVKIPISRGSDDIPKGTLDNILKAAGLKPFSESDRKRK